MLTMKPLNIDSNVEWLVETLDNGDYMLKNTFSDRIVDCFQARTAGTPCTTMKKNPKPTQTFFDISLP